MHCDGFLSPGSDACPHCAARQPAARPGRFAALRARLAAALASTAMAAVSVTLMACYGLPYDCPLGDDGGGESCPVRCGDDGSCAEGNYCSEAGFCEFGGFCADDRDCPDELACDVARATCTPPEPPAGPESCEGELTCDRAQPACPADTRPGIAGGCYTGSCLTAAECAELLCSSLTGEAECLARGECRAVYRGIDCRAPDGGPCAPDAAECQCERFAYDDCRPAPAG